MGKYLRARADNVEVQEHAPPLSVLSNSQARNSHWIGQWLRNDGCV